MLRVAAAVVFSCVLFGCKTTRTEQAPSGESAASPASTAGACQAAAEKLKECGVTAKEAGLEPCEERKAACIAGQGCEAIRKGETGCVFE